MTKASVEQSGLLPNQRAALEHAARGRAVFPCRANKQPWTRAGFKDASTDRALIADWWSAHPEALVGMPTGARNGVWVLDVDNHGGVPGEESLNALCAAQGELPETVVAMTPSGGMHFYFRHPRGGVEIPNSAGKLGLGLDVRGDGGYVIVAPSVLPDGRCYEWEGSSDPDEGVKVAAAPEWLLAMVAKNAEPVLRAEPSLDGEPIDEGGRNQHLFSLGRSLRAKGLTTVAIEAALLAENTERCKPPLPADEVRKTAASASSKPPGRSSDWRPPGQDGAPPALKVVGGTEFDDRPQVPIRNGFLPHVVDAVEEHLMALHADIFQHGTRLVRVGQWDAIGGPVERPVGAGVLVDISPEWLADQSTRLIRFERFDKRKDDWSQVDCPTKIASTLLARTGCWRFPVMTGFCDSPTLDLLGRIVSVPGYDQQSGLYLTRPPTLPALGVTDRSAAERAGECLQEAVETFPFVTDADESACIALIMTALLRRVLPAAPLGGVSATTPGTGKSKLVDVISAIATGRQAAVMALGHTPEELEKRVDSVLLKGDALCSFDNVDRPVKSDVLCQVATQPAKSVRVLALSKIVEAPTNVALFLTGNNLTLVGDLVRRCVVVNLDAGCERPELRQFDRDAVAYVLQRRGELIAASLTIAKAYVDAGYPEVEAPPFGGFEIWDRMVRRALMWAGLPDPLRPAEAMRDQDHELAGMIDLLAALEEVHPQPLSAAKLSAMVRERAPQVGDGWMAQYPALAEAAIQVMGELAKWGARELGYRLRAMQGRLFGGRRIVKTKKGKNGVQWYVENVAG